MPRNRNLADDDIKLKSNALEEDYLDVDKPLPGQNFYCISFVSPDKVLQRKDMWFFHHYEKNFIGKMKHIFNGKLDDIISKCEDGTVDISEIVALKKSVEDVSAKESCTFDEFKEKFEDFRFADEEKLNEAFDKVNNFQTSVRGVKVRGVFDTKREADVRAAVLQRQDPSFDVFVGQVGYWCPWAPNPQKIADIEYLNNDLNRLVKEYKANEAKKDAFYHEQKTSRQKDAHALSAEERLKHKEGLDKTMKEKEEIEKRISSSGGLVMPATNQPSSIINKEEVGEIQDMSSMITTDTEVDTAATDSKVIDVATTADATTADAKTNAITGLDLGGQESKEVTFEATTETLMGEDPWLQRKLQENKDTA